MTLHLAYGWCSLFPLVLFPRSARFTRLALTFPPSCLSHLTLLSTLQLSAISHLETRTLPCPPTLCSAQEPLGSARRSARDETIAEPRALAEDRGAVATTLVPQRAQGAMAVGAAGAAAAAQAAQRTEAARAWQHLNF